MLIHRRTDPARLWITARPAIAYCRALDANSESPIMSTAGRPPALLRFTSILTIHHPRMFRMAPARTLGALFSFSLPVNTPARSPYVIDREGVDQGLTAGFPRQPCSTH